MKSQIIEQLGQGDILLPSLIAEGLRANDRVKARLSVLQAVAGRLRAPDGTPFDLTQDCRSAGLDAVAMETLASHARVVAGDRMMAPGLSGLLDAVWDDMAAMIRPVAADDAAAGEAALRRLDAVRKETPLEAADTMALAGVARLTGLSDQGGDGLHRLVMDLHKALNRLSETHAEEILAGAHVFGLRKQDRAAVEAFMRGLDSTRRLKFDHPGLSTVASQSEGRLTIQNDIGETDAHVVVIAVEEEAVTVTYTDVHLIRARFFTGLLRGFAVKWSGLDRKSADGLGEDGVFYLVTGRCTTPDADSRDTFLAAVGASLVFLIDWNKARKLLKAWIPKADAIRLLDWAARERVGHRGFLELGGGAFVAAAVHHATPTRIGFGERLDEVLGREAAVEFLKTVLRVCAEALLDGRTARSARDRVEADLVGRLQRVDATLLAIVIRQAGLARDIAAGLAHFIAERQAGRRVDQALLAARARHIEEKADRIALDARNEIARFDADRSIERLVNGIEETIDELEQATFIASLVPETISAELLAPLGQLCAAAVTGAEAAASGAGAAAVVPEGHQIDAEDALGAIGRLIEAEHAGDSAERVVTAAVLGGEFDMKTALAVLELARSIERATDRLAGFGHLLREQVLADLSR
ncbi:hypothetical protein [Labrys monachus]|uniref:Uncharacterized protein Yka (UPF0111/DUF47 family) n=1 Tax=Labrys monachus TaxID=217067 RepID=A0ABU0FNQ9_9HYPH|nr:hypothetical protein [Labrys monachus]MDQ0396244.1 uncharacterized protein Yka (UPF0111/DUF47 family) [Labrys monachus]